VQEEACPPRVAKQRGMHPPMRPDPAPAPLPSAAYATHSGYYCNRQPAARPTSWPLQALQRHAPLPLAEQASKREAHELQKARLLVWNLIFCWFMLALGLLEFAFMWFPEAMTSL